MHPQHMSIAPASQLPDMLFPQSPQGLDFYIEQFDGKDCPASGTPLMRAVNGEYRLAVFFRPRCKRWGCPVCGEINTSLWAWRAAEGCRRLAASEKALAFVTLTSHEKLSPGGSWWVLPQAWMKLQARARRATGGFEYFAVPELHKSGKVHLHMLTSAALRKKWWKDNGRACGFGYQNDAKEVAAVGGVASYVAKYLSKTLQFCNIPTGTRRVRTSRGWPALPELEDAPGWDMELVGDDSVAAAAGGLRRRGYAVVFAGSKTAWKLVDATRADHGDEGDPR